MSMRRDRQTSRLRVLSLVGRPCALLGLAAWLLVACSRPDPSEVAARVAKQYYEQLIAGRYADFVDAHYQPDSIPATYREQLITNAKMYMAQQQADHHGIREVRVARAQTDTAGRQAQVFLVLCFGDSVNEEVVVPMVEHRGTWYLR